MAKERYLHGYEAPEQRRLIEQAEHWSRRGILKGTRLAPGERLLEVGCGVGAVLGVLGGAFPQARLHGVDWEAAQLRTARRHLASLGLRAELRQADALRLPYADAGFDHVWMMWFLEHVGDPLAALQEARRVLRPQGRFTSIEVDYATLQPRPLTTALEALLMGFRLGMDHGGRSDAGARLGGWLRSAGFKRIEDRRLRFSPKGAALVREVDYMLGFIEPALPAMAALPGAPPLALLEQGLRDWRRGARNPRGRLDLEVHKAIAQAPG